MSTNLDAFIHHYAKTIEDNDVDAMSACCSKPTVFVSDEGKRVCQSAKELLEVNGDMLRLLAKGGVVKAVPKVLQSMRLSDAIQFVSVKWMFYSADEQTLLSCNCSYTLQTTACGDIKIIVVVLDDENAALAQLRAMSENQ